MTQASRPQADNIANYPAPSDPGPYSADQWAELFLTLFTGDRATHQGPFRRYLNELEPADNGTTTVTVDTGAGIVNGHVLVSSEQETFAIPAGPVASRTDRVVIVENNQNVEVTQTVAGRPLLFPNDLSEYTATPGVPAYSARLAIVRGADGAGLPGIDQTTALYMVELYRYDINNVPTISNATDYRNFAKTTTASKHQIAQVDVPALTTPATIDFSNIPSIFAHLRLVCYLRNTNVSNFENINLTFNGDAGANYDDVYLHGIGNGTRASGAVYNQNNMTVGQCCGQNAGPPASWYDPLTIDIPNYANTTFYKTVNAQGGTYGHGATTTTKTTHNTGWWHSAAAITSISLFPQNGNWQQLCRVTLYGLD